MHSTVETLSIQIEKWWQIALPRSSTMAEGTACPSLSEWTRNRIYCSHSR